MASTYLRWLAAHNKVRAQYGVQALTWDTTLEAFAKRVTSTCVWKHTENNQYGENIAAGQSSLEAVVSDWVEGANEKASYVPSSPHYSHFTQVVWASSTQLGCAVTSCQDLKGGSLPQSPIPFYACEYNPPGNVEGEYAQNVKALQGGAPAVKT
ncbi:hypothetical protein CROQUDRAFT_45346 [Cronartium quercuum f. sp. fusiforme G11]|uniref:SCP domain-containing protein n=1 Tax=Cronartium quercuum f. sp. fusiforme G11 TaxID=708437 RepID=A0A9P6NKB7_9BASI|nr:hypothetical protein CROQUDRAFT_45346 [Cronartium quercuum f. sp. fusiforme G11]